MNKILYAINHRATENAITERIKSDYLPVGAVSYKESIAMKLGELGANTLLIRDSLPGSTDFLRLLKRIRVDYPDVRIIVICAERPKMHPFLTELVGLGIYDIINSDKPTLTDIVSYIMTPRTFRDAAQYGVGLPESPHKDVPAPASDIPVQQEPVRKSGGGFDFTGAIDGILRGFRSLKGSVKDEEPTEVQPITTVPSATPQIDIELLRQTFKESEARKAQENLDAMIRTAVDKQTSTLKEENKRLAQQVDGLMAEIASTEQHSSNVAEELNSIRGERDKLQIMLNDLRKETQAGYEIYEQQLRALQNPTDTPEWYLQQSTLWNQQKAKLSGELEAKTKEAEDLGLQVGLLTEQVRTASRTISELQEKLSQAQQVQVTGSEADELINQLRAELATAKNTETELTKRLEEIRAELAIVSEGGPDYSKPVVNVPLLPDTTIYTQSGHAPQTIMMLGAKHGVGTTSVALNLAASIAAKGYKTLLIEVNAHYPMLNQYFEFTHIPYGIDETLSSIAAGNLTEIDKAIIRPHGLRPSQGNLARIYKKLPAGLHFMLFSNDSLVSHHYDQNFDLSEATIHSLLRYLSKRQQYSHVILDVQVDDYRLLECILKSGYPIDKLGVVITQDPHAIASTGTLITYLARTHASSLVASGEFIINRHNANVSITTSKIEKMLHIGSTQISKLSEDSAGYVNASGTALPYILNKGRFAMEYEQLRGKMLEV